MVKKQSTNLSFKTLLFLQFQKIVGKGSCYFLMLLLPLAQTISAEPLSSSHLCRAYFAKTDLYQSFSSVERDAFHAAVISFMYLQSKTDQNSLSAKAHLQRQMDRFQKDKGLSAEQKIYFAKLFQEDLQDRMKSMGDESLSEAQILRVMQDTRVEFFEKERLRQKQLQEIFEKYNTNSVDEALVNSSRKENFDNDTKDIEFLLEVGANPNYINSSRWGALHWAASTNFTQAIELLIQAGANIELPFTNIELPFANKSTPLLLAASSRSTDAAKLLILKGANTDQMDGAKNTVYVYASRFGDLALLKFLISKDEKFNVQNKKYIDSFINAILGHKENVIDFFITSGIKINNLYFDDGHTPLTLAVNLGYEKLVTLFLKAGADTSIKTKPGKSKFGKTAIELATEKPEILRILKNHEATKPK